MSFLFPTLVAIGLPLIAVPLLIHLINVRRQRRIQWAAMEFLLASQKRHRKWILLKQFLLLLLRMAAVAAVALMLAQPLVRSEWGGFLGGTATHHLVLLDDSYSMTDRRGSTTAFDRAKQVVQQIGERAATEGGTHLFSMLRFSEAAELTAGSQPDVFREPVNDALGERLESLLGPRGASETAAGPVETFEALARLPKGEDGETRIVYLVSDFREREWARTDELRRLLLSAQESNAQLHFVACVSESHDNLAITSLRPQLGLQAAGVEMWMELAVANYGDLPARGVAVQLAEDGHPRAAIELETIPPRETMQHRVRVNFPTAGPHSITATLPTDAVPVDNRRFFAADVPGVLPILIVDGTKTGEDGRRVRLALAPGGSVQSGWQPTVQPPSYLRRSEELPRYAAIFLLDVPRLDPTELEALEAYVQSGGGVAFFVGTQMDREHVNAQWYRDGQGLFPAPLRLPTQLLPPVGEAGPDVVVTDHPVFRIFAGERNSHLETMLVDFYYALEDDWQPPLDGHSQIIARLRNRAPLVLEKRLGDGRVIAFLSKASPEESGLGRWNNWARNPAFLVVLNELAGYLSIPWRREPERTVGEPIVVELEEADYDPSVRFHLPSDAAAAAEDAVEIQPVDATSSDGILRAALPTTSRSGLYRVEVSRRDGQEEPQLFAINVPSGEGDLRMATETDLVSRLEGVRFRYHGAGDFADQAPEIAGFQLADSVLYVLLAILVIEQLLAYLLSYHPKPIPSDR